MSSATNKTLNRPEVLSFFDKDSFTISHIVIDPETNHCTIIDSVLDYDASSGCTSKKSADALISEVQRRNLVVDFILETHVHADHLSAAPYLKSKLGGKEAIGSNIKSVQGVFGDLFNEGDEFHRDGSQFDLLLEDGQTFKIGNIDAKALYTPGHTPACMTYLIGDACFVGDTLFMPDYGTARCDFPGGDAATLYQSVQKIYALPDETRMFMCHDYLPEGRDQYVWETTVGEQRKNNIHIHEGVTEQAFVKMRTERDAGLSMPKLILPSVQVNMRAGQMPPAESNGQVYLKIPVDAF